MTAADGEHGHPRNGGNALTAKAEVPAAAATVFPAPSAATMGGAVPAAVMFHLASVFTQESTPKPHAAERREERERPAPGWKENRRT